jgi:hypothetical protein
LKGHFGAWESNILGFPSFRREIQAREQRIRQRDIVTGILALLLSKSFLTNDYLRKVVILFSGRGIFSVLLLILSAKIGDRTLRVIAHVFFPKIMRRAIAIVHFHVDSQREHTADKVETY